MKGGHVNGADCTKQAIMSKYISEINFFTDVHLQLKTTLEEKNRKIFGYNLCDIEVTENLRDKFAIFPPVFKTTLVSKNDFVDLIKMCAERREKCLNVVKC